MRSIKLTHRMPAANRLTSSAKIEAEAKRLYYLSHNVHPSLYHTIRAWELLPETAKLPWYYQAAGILGEHRGNQP